ncbi:YIEGIA domain-containing protein [Dendrosporobacter sp. 1207_IL3150]|uniref:YIEGIA domain-containing protein n=1 Tax=Dendrosporobacter sp. 1207_IL3150 TaxID=3084054 RepID=UPI002FDB0DF2
MGAGQGVLNSHDLLLIVIATVMGTLARFLALKVDYRQYPSYPNGYMIHIVTGFISASLGAVAIPALMSKNYTAVTFLALALTQFRDVRKTEKDSLKDLENTEFTPRGDAYIDGIAKSFESRNYFALMIAISAGITIELLKESGPIISSISGIIVSFILYYFISQFSKGRIVNDIAKISIGHIEIKESSLFVDEIFISNLVGTDNAEKMLLDEGMAIVIEPKEDHFSITLDNFGQRKAMLFEATRTLGVKRYHFTRKDFATGKTVIVFVPIIRDVDKLISVVKNTPLLESVKKSYSIMSR